ncbi:Crp/Fnr family transcriptional regulator [Gallaecimonas xiamenensis]|uniref:Crp/Fnr family transcriptional regulator n=1 Tax=Gallaecimonas xiamenensis 3-C-1 TaxID=745411 RepID=K2JU81_9GAMM|nr:Crp/Fnr family transcriptional regulator [Gallaecimonas xiamenensis]EKE73954.1 Crp/Fnr family transcriptional regulator [Gallaecimonas xiamenensis 3-C-1]
MLCQPGDTSLFSPQQLASVLGRGQWFKDLHPECSQWLLAQGRFKRLAPGQYLFRRGDGPCGLYGVLDGVMAMTGQHPDGRSAMLAMVSAPDWFGEIALFDGRQRTHDAQAQGPTLLWHLPQGQVRAWLAQHPRHWQDFGLLMGQKLRLLMQWHEDSALQTPLARLARRLWLLAHSHGNLQPGQSLAVELPVSQQQLADMLAMSRQSINGLLQELQSGGVLALGRGKVRLLALDKLSGYLPHS